MKLIVEVYPDGSCYAYRQSEETHATAQTKPVHPPANHAELDDECNLSTHKGKCFVFDIGPDEVKTDYEHLRRLLFAVIDDLSILAGDRIGPSDMTWQDIAITTSVNLHALAYAVAETRNQGGVVFPSPTEALDEDQSVEYVRYRIVPVRDGMDFGARAGRTTIATARNLARQMLDGIPAIVPEKVIILGTYNKGRDIPKWDWEIVEEVT